MADPTLAIHRTIEAVWRIESARIIAGLARRRLAEPALRGYHLLPSVRADLLARLNRMDEAHAEYERAATLTRNQQERTLLLGRAARCQPDD
ncbi:hypothetical protein ACQUJS_18175 [Ralstonia pseudosolanacearum]|uniref:Rna polymerase sigma factor containing a tpr repeat domain transcription regulator protein n=1 Tax=Ralstonia solanacearum TaxID=305 RepID=A0A0S4TQK3_RALSL